MPKGVGYGGGRKKAGGKGKRRSKTKRGGKGKKKKKRASFGVRIGRATQSFKMT